MSSDTATVNLEYLADPYLPRRCVVCFAGRGGTAKSSFIATVAADISDRASTLWVSVEEPTEWIRVRHIKCAGAEGTLAVVAAVPSKKDKQGRTIGSSFNVYEHLEPAISQARRDFDVRHSSIRPLQLVVLDTAVGLTGWGKGESPNDDASVKRLLAYLQSLAEKYDLTIAFIQHANKGKHDYFADTVAGASAWTNSPRLSFIHASDRRDDYSYVLRVAKSNLTQPFGATYETEAIHTLYQRDEGADSVLCKVIRGPIVWGNSDSMGLWDDATAKPRDWDDGNTMRPTLVDMVTNMLLEMVMNTPPEQPITREDVVQRYGRIISRREWTKVDAKLRDDPAIILDHGDQNKRIYRRKLEPS